MGKKEVKATRPSDKPTPVIEVSVHGVTFPLDVKVFDDYEVIEALDALDRGSNPLRLALLFQKLAGDHYDTLLDRLRKAGGGRIGAEDAANTVTDILKQAAKQSPN